MTWQIDRKSVRRIRQLLCPLFVMHGQRDDIIPFYHGFRLHKAGAKGKGTVRQEHSISFHFYWKILDVFWGVSKAAPLASLFPSSCRQMQRHQTSLVHWYILQFPTLFPFWRYCFSTKFYLFRISQIGFTWCFWCQAIMTWWRQTCEPTSERWWISALPTGVASEIHGVFGTQLSWCIKWPVDTYMSRETAKIGLWGGMKAF